MPKNKSSKKPKKGTAAYKAMLAARKMKQLGGREGLTHYALDRRVASVNAAALSTYAQEETELKRRVSVFEKIMAVYNGAESSESSESLQGDKQYRRMQETYQEALKKLLAFQEVARQRKTNFKAVAAIEGRVKDARAIAENSGNTQDVMKFGVAQMLGIHHRKYMNDQEQFFLGILEDYKKRSRFPVLSLALMGMKKNTKYQGDAVPVEQKAAHQCALDAWSALDAWEKRSVVSKGEASKKGELNVCRVAVEHIKKAIKLLREAAQATQVLRRLEDSQVVQAELVALRRYIPELLSELSHIPSDVPLSPEQTQAVASFLKRKSVQINSALDERKLADRGRGAIGSGPREAGETNHHSESLTMDLGGGGSAARVPNVFGEAQARRDQKSEELDVSSAVTP